MIFVDLQWKKSGRWYLPGQGYTKRGGNEGGTQLPPNYAKLILIYIDCRGNKLSENIISPVLEVNGWAKLSKFRITLLKQKLNRTKYFDLNELNSLLKV